MTPSLFTSSESLIHNLPHRIFTLLLRRNKLLLKSQKCTHIKINFQQYQHSFIIQMYFEGHLITATKCPKAKYKNKNMAIMAASLSACTMC